MTELEYKRDIISLFKGRGWGVQSHEDMISNFIPDLSVGFGGVDGWVELKYTAKPPKSLDSIHHYTRGQQDWLIERGKRGSGHCYLLVGTAHYHYLWRWDVLLKVRRLPWAAAASEAVCVGDIGEVIRALQTVVQR